MGWTQTGLERYGSLCRLHRFSKILCTGFQAHLCKNVRLNVEKNRVVRFSRKFCLHRREGAIKIVGISSRQTLRRRAERLVRVKFVGLLKISLSALVLT